MGLFVHFGDAAGMATTGERGFQPGIDDVLGGVDGGLASEAEDVGVIVLAGDGGSGGIMHEAGLDTGVAIRRDAHADAGGADEDACIRAAIEHTGGHEFGVVGVIDTVRGKDAEVLDGVAGVQQVVEDGVLEVESAMVRSDGDGFWKV